MKTKMKFPTLDQYDVIILTGDNTEVLAKQICGNMRVFYDTEDTFKIQAPTIDLESTDVVIIQDIWSYNFLQTIIDLNCPVPIILCCRENMLDLKFIQSKKVKIIDADNTRFIGAPVSRYAEFYLEDYKSLTTLGWQPQGFWAFSDAVIIDGIVCNLDDKGRFLHQGKPYFISSHKKGAAASGSWKNTVYNDVPFPLEDYLQLITDAYGTGSYSAILYTLATVFSDIIFESQSFFPLYYLCGEASAGKSSLTESCQALFGKRQDPYMFMNQPTADMRLIKAFSESRNMIIHISEYDNGNPDVDEMCKGFWGRMGYTRVDRENYSGTEQVFIESSAWITSNSFIQNETLRSRVVLEHLETNQFSEDQKVAYNQLRDLKKEGVSGYLVEVLKNREKFEQEFKSAFDSMVSYIKERTIRKKIYDRQIHNLAVLGATYKILEANISFPFALHEWLDHAVKMTLLNNDPPQKFITLKSGTELIEKERDKQIIKHGFTGRHHAVNPELYQHYQLQQAAWTLLGMEGPNGPYSIPAGWDKDWFDNLVGRDRKQRLIIAGALLAAELDRLNELELMTYKIQQP